MRKHTRYTHSHTYTNTHTHTHTQAVWAAAGAAAAIWSSWAGVCALDLCVLYVSVRVDEGEGLKVS